MKPRMGTRPRLRLQVEGLEGRELMTVTASVSAGTLYVNSTAAAQLDVVQSNIGEYTISANGKPVSVVQGVTAGLQIQLGSQNEQLALNLMGGDVVGNVKILNSGGNDQITIGNGVIQGNLQVSATSGKNQIQLGAYSPGLEVIGTTEISGGTGNTNGLAVAAITRLQGNVTATNINTITMAQGSRVAGDVVVSATTSAPMTTVLNGRIDKNVTITGSNETDLITVGHSAQIGNFVCYLGAGNNVVSLDGVLGARFGGRVLVQAGSGNNTVVSQARDLGRLSMNLGSGNNQITLSAKVGRANNLNKQAAIILGSGTSTVTVNPDFYVFGSGSVEFGNANDTFVLRNRTVKLALNVNGGGGQNKFVGNPKQMKFNPVNFENLG